MELKRIDYLHSGINFRPTTRSLIDLDTLSKNNGITRLQEKPKIILSNEQLQQLLYENSLLISASRPLLNKTFSSLSDKTNLLFLTSVDGYIIDLISSPEILHSFFMKGIVLGANMNYASIGTNSISMSIQDKCPISVLGKEHYCTMLHSLNCFTTPLKVNNKIISFLSVSALEADSLLYLTSIITLLTDLIENQLTSIPVIKCQSNDTLCKKSAVSFVNNIIDDRINFYGTLIIHSNFLFTMREIETLHLLYNKKDADYIIKKLCITKNTFKTHLKNIYQKLNVKNLNNCLLKIDELLGKNNRGFL